ncbi:MAG: CoB--CoM heterodisulfide reductase iron-sulfur subunit A family protein [Candidatus Thermoplasmatota archaeon]|nr:CoB--CoM heterodisulfide reductase iron-sulfur subunit A family protein [Candidatus Thermoplasmatota archaeon]
MARIGVFICHCGHNIASAVAVEEVVKFARTLPDVVYSDHNLYSCSEEGLGSIKKSIEENKLDRVVVAACTPRTHEPLFRRLCEQAGINKYLFEFVNIREHCSWIHAKEPNAATEKAKKLVAMGVSKAALLEPQVESESGVIPTAVVIGGGLAGLTAAASLVAQDIDTHLIEMEGKLGGQLNDISILAPNFEKSADLLNKLVSELKKSERGHIHLGAKLVDVKGFVGNFEITVEEEGVQNKIPAGAIILATGTQEHQPEGEYGFRKAPGVVTQLEFERALQRGEVPKRVVFIQCVGSRQPGREYCSRICCNTSLKNALRVVEAGGTAAIIHRDIMSYGAAWEELYRQASERGVAFFRYSLEDKPRISAENKHILVEVFDDNLGEGVTLHTDLVVLATPLVSRDDSGDVSRMLKVPRDKNGFYLEAHVKLRPIEFATDGVFICGSARWPSSAREVMCQALAAAAKAAIPIKRGKVVTEAITAWSDPDKCAGCGNCVIACPYEAIEIVDQDGRKIAKVNETQCKGCGNCVAACPNDAMQQRGFTTRQLSAMIDALVKRALEESS